MLGLVQIEIFRLGSDALELELHLQSSVHDVKCLAAEHWEQSLAGIFLFRDEDRLADITPLADICEPGSSELSLLCLLMDNTAWFDDLKRQFANGNRRSVFKASRLLGQGMPFVGDVAEAHMLSPLLEHKLPFVKEAAFLCLQNSAWTTGKAMSDFIVTHLLQRPSCVREFPTCCNVLAKVSEPGEASVVGALVGRFKLAGVRNWGSYNQRNKLAILEALLHVTTAKDDDALLLLYSSTTLFTSQIGFWALQQILPKDHNFSVGSLRAACENVKQPQMLKSFVDSMILRRSDESEAASGRCDEVLGELVASALRNPFASEKILEEVAHALGCFHKVPCHLVEMLGACSENGDKRVRISALRALTPLVGKCDETVSSVLRRFLDDSDDGVRARATRHLDAIAKHGGA